MLHSVSYAGVWPGQARLALDDFAGAAARLGFAGVMLMAKRPHLSPLDYPPEKCRELRANLRSRNLACAVLAGYNNFSADLEHPDIPHREIQIEHVTQLARMAHELECPVVRVFTAYEHPSLSYASMSAMLIDTLGECARRAAPLGVTIGVQNHHDFAAHHDSLFDLVTAIAEPNCRAIFDAWAPALQGADLAAAARKLAPLTCHTTAADYQLRPRFHYNPRLVNYEPATAWTQAVPMGEGFIDYKGFFAAMREGGYAGPVAYEMCSPLTGGGSMENLNRYAAAFLDYLRGV